MNLYKKVKHVLEERHLWEVFTYLFFGGLTTLVNIAVHFLCLDLFRWHYIVATIVSWTVSVLFAFVTNKIWVFQSKSTSIMAWWSEFARFIFYRLLSLAMDVGCMYLLIEVFAMSNLFAKIFTQILVVLANYIFSKFLIFQKNDHKTELKN
uniref:GtrA family protein n=1 Tax=Candidatus Enterococcus willemsii TaxID=1857215 RepID=UPI00403F36CE